MDGQKRTVSVIIPTHNREDLVGRSIRSVISQTYRDMEIIIVNDASKDNTEAVVRGFEDDRIKYIRHDMEKGASAARNTGIKEAEGRYIAFLDDDDEWMPEKIEKQVNKMESSSEKVGLIYCGTEISDGKNVIRKYYPEEKGNVKKRLLLGPTVGGTDPVLVKKECFDRVGMFDEELKSCQDWDMWKRVSDCYEFDLVPEILVRLYAHKGQISADLALMIPGRTSMVMKHMEELSEHPDILIIHLKRIGKLHCINGTWKEAFGWFKKAVKISPMEIFRIAGWVIWELPGIKFFSKQKEFKRYDMKEV